jgi:hypothetical protein
MESRWGLINNRIDRLRLSLGFGSAHLTGLLVEWAEPNPTASVVSSQSLPFSPIDLNQISQNTIQAAVDLNLVNLLSDPL